MINKWLKLVSTSYMGINSDIHVKGGNNDDVVAVVNLFIAAVNVTEELIVSLSGELM